MQENVHLEMEAPLENETPLPLVRSSTACFTGHRYIQADRLAPLTRLLDEKLAALYQQGYRTFISGGALGFDTLAAERVSVFQCGHPDVKLILAMPCADQDARWRPVERAQFGRMRYLADQVRVLSPFYYDGCMQARNRFMVDQSSLCIAYYHHPGGGTQFTLGYALRQQVEVCNLSLLLPAE